VSLTAAYAVSGKLALLLAVPPGFASPIFPPAGIAVAAMLIGMIVTVVWRDKIRPMNAVRQSG